MPHASFAEVFGPTPVLPRNGDISLMTLQGVIQNSSSNELQRGIWCVCSAKFPKWSSCMMSKHIIVMSSDDGGRSSSDNKKQI